MPLHANMYLAVVSPLPSSHFSYLGRESVVFISAIEPFSTAEPLRGMRCKYAKKERRDGVVKEKLLHRPQGHSEQRRRLHILLLEARYPLRCWYIGGKGSE